MSTSLVSSTFIDDTPAPGGKALQPRPARDVPISLGSVATFVAWSVCAAVSLAALFPANRRVTSAPAPAPLVKPVRLEVRLTDRAVEPAATRLSAPPPSAASSDTAPAPDIPPIAAVAEPSPAIAFAVPVEGPVRIVPLAEAARSPAVDRNANRTAPSGSTAPQTLIFGQGEGVQPAPAYPARAAKLFQEGVVLVRLTVDADGRVVSASAQEPCAWPLLNEAAVRTVEQKWRFRPGEVRVFDVSIHFRLKR